MRYYVGIDIGTTCTKTVLFDEKGNAEKVCAYAYPIIQPRDGCMEQKAEEWWGAVVKGLNAITTIVRKEDIYGVGVTGQFQTLVMLDKFYKIIRNPILWCDRRDELKRQEIIQKVGEDRLAEITSNPSIHGSTAAKLLWVKENEPENYEKCYHVMLPNDYIRFRLTGELATDVTNGSSMWLMDSVSRQWSEDLIDKLDIDKSLLSVIYESEEVIGKITPTASRETGLMVGTPVVAAAGDTLSTAIGTGAISDGTAFLSLGTSGMICGNTCNRVVDRTGAVSIYCAADRGKWSYITCLPAAGLCLRWIKDICCQELMLSPEGKENIYNAMNMLAANTVAGSNRLLFMPYMMGDRTPHMDSDVRGAFIGLSTIHTKSDMIRAVMEGVAFSQKDCVIALTKLGINIDDLVICGGGANSKVWCGIMSDVMELTVHTLKSEHGCALGSAILAAVGTGAYSNIDEAVSQMVIKGASQECNKNNFDIYRHLFNVFDKAYCNLAGISRELIHI